RAYPLTSAEIQAATTTHTHPRRGYLTQGTPVLAMPLGSVGVGSLWWGAAAGAGVVVGRFSGMVKLAPSITRRCPVGTVESWGVGGAPSIVARVLAVVAEPGSG